MRSDIKQSSVKMGKGVGQMINISFTKSSMSINHLGVILKRIKIKKDKRK